MNTTIFILGLGLPLMLVMRVPLAFAIGLATIGVLWSADIDMMIFAQRMVSGTQSFSLLAIPFFILAGDLMTAGGISRRLVGFADVLVRHRTGGLGMVAVLAATFFAALSGSAPATTAAIGVIMISDLEKRGYSRPFATALAVAGGIIGPMLPPSIPMVVWGVMSETSISQLFLAGGRPSAQALSEDALAIHDHLEDHARSDAGWDRPPVVIGLSIGAGPATHLATRRPVQGLILVTPFDSLTRLAQARFPWAPVGLLLRHRMEPAADLNDSDVSVAMIAAMRDEIIPAARTEALREALSQTEPGIVFDQPLAAGHNDLYGHPDFAGTLREAMATLISGDTAPPGPDLR